MTANESEALITINARRDPGFPGRLFIALRRYDLNADDPPVDSSEVGTIEDALDVVRCWLHSLSESSVSPADERGPGEAEER